MPGSNGKLFIADIHRGQQAIKVKSYFLKKVNISVGLTGYIQVLDVVVNKLFKAYVWRLSEKYIEKNLESYVDGKISASERCGKA